MTSKMALYSLFALLALCSCKREEQRLSKPAADAPEMYVSIRFTEVAKQWGIDFTHQNGARGRKLMPETVGSGVAFADLDGDGWLDILIVNSSNWSNDKHPSQTLKLYRNRGYGKFEDVTKGSGLEKPFYGMGVAVADYDGDGREDVFLTAVGENHLFHNEGNLHFREVTHEAGVSGVPPEGIPMQYKWSTGASWLDYDRDGNLDLLVCQYVKWSPEIDPFCGHNGLRGYCPPDNFEGAHCTLYRGDGKGHFRDVSKQMGLLDCALGKSFGIGVLDVNHDGWLDIVITNDTWANFLFINHEGRRFEEIGVPSGIALSENGKARAGMGIDVADWRNNGQQSIVIGNFTSEGLSLFEPERGGVFADHAQVEGITTPSLLNVTFATFFLDVDFDGWLDIFATNGHVDDIVNTYQSNLTFREKPLLLRNRLMQAHTASAFEDISKNAGFTEPLVGRGAAFGDLDGDGKLEIGIVDNGGRFRLYHNESTGVGNWIRFKLIGAGKNLDAIGSLVEVTAGGITHSLYVKSGVGFLSESERNPVFGLGRQDKVERVIVHWSDGKQTTYDAFPGNKTHVLKENTP